MIDTGIRAVFFDAVGTLLFPRNPVSQTYADHGRRHGANLSDDAVRRAFRAASARQEAIDHAAGWRTNEDRERARWRAIVADVIPGADGDRCFTDLWEWYGRSESWAVNCDAAEVLGALVARGLTVGIASNFDARLVPLVEAFPDLGPVRGRCVASSLIGWRKPSVHFFAALTTAAGSDPDQILYVGDDVRNDFEGAVAAGLRAVLLDPATELARPGRIRRLRDLVAG